MSLILSFYLCDFLLLNLIMIIILYGDLRFVNL